MDVIKFAGKDTYCQPKPQPEKHNCNCGEWNCERKQLEIETLQSKLESLQQDFNLLYNDYKEIKSDNEFYHRLIQSLVTTTTTIDPKVHFNR